MKCDRCDGAGRSEKYAHGGLYCFAPDRTIVGRVTEFVTCSKCRGTGRVADEATPKEPS